MPRTARWNAAAQRWDGDRPVSATTPPRTPADVPPLPGFRPFVPAAAAPGPPLRWLRTALPRLLRRHAVVLVAAAVLGAGVAAWFAWGDAGGRPSAAPSERASGSGATGGPAPDGGTTGPGDTASPDAAESDGAPGAEPPAGYRLDGSEAQGGFTTAVPRDWPGASDEESGVFFRSADGDRLLRAVTGFVVDEPGYSAEQALGVSAAALRDQYGDGADGYRQDSEGPVDSGSENPEGDAAELVYGHGDVAAVERVFTAADGTLYALVAAVPADEADAARELMDTAAAFFAPDPPAGGGPDGGDGGGDGDGGEDGDDLAAAPAPADGRAASGTAVADARRA